MKSVGGVYFPLIALIALMYRVSVYIRELCGRYLSSKSTQLVGMVVACFNGGEVGSDNGFTFAGKDALHALYNLVMVNA